jgi:hypothetical protein
MTVNAGVMFLSTDCLPANNWRSAMNHDLESNKENAIAFYRTAYLGEPSRAVEKYVGAVYVQHNPAVGDRKQAFIDYFDEMAKAYPGNQLMVARLMLPIIGIMKNLLRNFRYTQNTLRQSVNILNGRMVITWLYQKLNVHTAMVPLLILLQIHVQSLTGRKPIFIVF